MDVDITGTGFDAGRLHRIAEHLDQHYVSKGKIAGAQVAVGRRGRVAYLAAIGLRDTAVVVTDKATLVLPLDRSQDVRQVVAEVQRLGRTDLL